MNLSYDEIRRIHRLEKNSSKLVDVSEDFFNSLNDFVEEEKNSYIKNLKNFSIEEARDFANLKKMVEEIFLLRERKILNAALLASRSGETERLNAASQEKKMFESVVALLLKQRELLSDMFSSADQAAVKGKAREKTLEVTEVRMLSEVPAFIGPDLKEYGPFSQDQKVSLPYKVAKLFFERKLATPDED